ncbi:MAG: thiamine phosphate synthase [Clostridium sp.]
MIYLITNRHLVSKERYLKVIEEASLGGVEIIILREKDLDERELEKIFWEIKERVLDSTKIIINSNIECAKRVKAYGIHLPFNDFLSYENNGDFVVGVSIHTLQEGIEAYKRGANYILASNIYETRCKEGVKGKGIEFIKELKKNIKIPIIALGGINNSNCKEVIDAKADGVGVMSYLFNSKNVLKDVSALVE